MPSTVIPETSRAANAKTSELLSGSQISPIPHDGVLNMYAAASAIGLNHTLTIGGVVVIDDQEITALRAAGVGLQKKDDYVGAFRVRAGQSVRYFQRNTTGGAITTKAVFDVL